MRLTRSETYDNRRALDLRDELERRFVDGLDPPGRYTISIGTGLVSTIPPSQQGTAVDAIESWIRSQELVPPASTYGQLTFVTGSPPSTPVEISLYRAPCLPEDDGQVRFALGRGEDAENQRDVRVRRALSTKLGKLESSRVSNALTVLVLESNDFIMSNPVVIAHAVRRCMDELTLPEPDVIINIETSAGDHWFDYLIKVGNWWSVEPR